MDRFNDYVNHNETTWECNDPELRIDRKLQLEPDINVCRFTSLGFRYVPIAGLADAERFLATFYNYIMHPNIPWKGMETQEEFALRILAANIAREKDINGRAIHDNYKTLNLFKYFQEETCILLVVDAFTLVELGTMAFTSQDELVEFLKKYEIPIDRLMDMTPGADGNK